MILVRFAKATALAERHLKGHQNISRRANELVQTDLRELEVNEIAEGFFSPAPNDSLTLYFACECMDESCEERVQISFSKYNSLHLDRNQFIVLPEHQTQFQGMPIGTMKYSVVNNLWKLSRNKAPLTS
jgi:hypothetical protein